MHRAKRVKTGTSPWLWAFPVTTFGLGCWQVYRLQWKLGLIEQLQDAVKSDPIPLREGLEEYTRVKVEGTFAEDQFHVGPRSYDTGGQGSLFTTSASSGYYVYSPMDTPMGRIIVNRGWVPIQKKEVVATPVILLSTLTVGETGAAGTCESRRIQNNVSSRE